MFERLAEFLVKYQQRGTVLLIWKAYKQVQVGKGKCIVSDGMLCAADLRPICVASMVWRICNKAQFSQEDTQLWLQRTFPTHVYVGFKRRGVEDPLVSLLSQSRKDWFVGSLGLSKAFDMVAPSLALRILARLRMPKGLTDLIQAVWENLLRLLRMLL